ncbi:MAG TPA: matrixin family metalloprotease [Bryobacteraceae bacterium]|nr:matrixin family metalloprotease [Bryobacteraceae bacterium]
MLKTILLLGIAALAAQAETAFTYWIEPCQKVETGCQPRDPELAEWAVKAWVAAGQGKLVLTRATRRASALIHVQWATAEEGLFGETQPILVNGRRGGIVNVRPAPLQPNDPLLRETIVYLTCLHELGHALGLVHTSDFADIMYSFQFGGDIQEYFGRYRRRLRTRDDITRNPGMSDEDREQLQQALARMSSGLPGGDSARPKD